MARREVPTARVRAWVRLLAGAAALAALSASPLPAQRTTSRCNECHARLSETSGGGHGFTAWQRSRHGAVGVGCEACHGGDPTAADAQVAHRGVHRSSDTASTVFFTRVPDTCGRCHASEAGYFRSSVHYARLRSDGHGPNCVTCHGAMATSVLSPERVLGTCSACHAATGVASVGKAREAAQVLALVRATNVLYDVVATSAGSRRSGRVAGLLTDAERQLSAAAEVWHSFRLDSAAARLEAARGSLVAAWIAQGHPAPAETRVRRPTTRRP